MKDKETKKRNKPIPPGANEYYYTSAVKLGYFKWASVLLLITALLGCVVFARDEITTHNLSYLVKHFDVNNEDVGSNFSTLRYDSNGNYRFGYYKDDLVIVSPTSVDYYDMHGSSVLSKTQSMSDPRLVATDGYLYVYDNKGYSYSVYDSFFNLKNIVTDFPIYDFTASSNGVYAYLSKSLDYRSVVYVYDKSYKLKSKISKDKVIMDISISKDGSRLLILSCETEENGEFYTEVTSVRPGQSEAEFTVRFDGIFPLYGGYFSDGNACLVSTESIITLDKNGNTVAKTDFPSQFPTSLDLCGNSIAVSFKDSVIGAKTIICLYDSSANEMKKYSLSGHVQKMIYDYEYIFTLLTDSIGRINVKSGEVLFEQTESNPLDFIIRDEKSLLICYGNRTQAIDNIFSPLSED